MEGTETLSWRKSSFSGNGGPNCVEIAFSSHGRAAGLIRDSKSPERGHLTVMPDAWCAFLTDVKLGAYI